MRVPLRLDQCPFLPAMIGPNRDSSTTSGNSQVNETGTYAGYNDPQPTPQSPGGRSSGGGSVASAGSVSPTKSPSPTKGRRGGSSGTDADSVASPGSAWSSPGKKKRAVNVQKLLLLPEVKLDIDEPCNRSEDGETERSSGDVRAAVKRFKEENCVKQRILLMRVSAGSGSTGGAWLTEAELIRRNCGETVQPASLSSLLSGGALPTGVRQPEADDSGANLTNINQADNISSAITNTSAGTEESVNGAATAAAQIGGSPTKKGKKKAESRSPSPNKKGRKGPSKQGATEDDSQFSLFLSNIILLPDSPPDRVCVWGSKILSLGKSRP